MPTAAPSINLVLEASCLAVTASLSSYWSPFHPPSLKHVFQWTVPLMYCYSCSYPPSSPPNYSHTISNHIIALLFNVWETFPLTPAEPLIWNDTLDLFFTCSNLLRLISKAFSHSTILCTVDPQSLNSVKHKTFVIKPSCEKYLSKLFCPRFSPETFIC